MSTPIPDPGAVPDEPNFGDLPSTEQPAVPGPVPADPDEAPDDASDAGTGA